jgi:hypothetical protein
MAISAASYLQVYHIAFIALRDHFSPTLIPIGFPCQFFTRLPAPTDCRVSELFEGRLGSFLKGLFCLKVPLLRRGIVLACVIKLEGGVLTVFGI